MGFVKSEWTVSYGYGFATSLSALSLLRRTASPDPIFALQAAALIFYGFRLNAHLFIRNRISILKLMKVLVAGQWLGFGMGALGDATKSYVKKTKGENTLVTSGIFSILRHPNYTGEIIGWTCNALLGALTGAYLLKDTPHKVGLIGLTALGWMGITFVLLGATRSLEQRQKKDYGSKEEYKKWIDSTWSGWYLAKNEKDAATDAHEITLDEATEEESGSGI
ncbi:MAG: hypothetical protein SGARI_004998 [Bacillariaceae sp.]